MVQVLSIVAESYICIHHSLVHSSARNLWQLIYSIRDQGNNE